MIEHGAALINDREDAHAPGKIQGQADSRADHAHDHRVTISDDLDGLAFTDSHGHESGQSGSFNQNVHDQAAAGRRELIERYGL